MNDNWGNLQGSVLVFAPPAALLSVLVLQVIVAEMLIVVNRILLGLIVHVIAGAGMLVAMQRATEEYQLVFQSLFLLPVIRSFNLGVSWFAGSDLEFIGGIYLVCLSSVVIIARSQRWDFITGGATLSSVLVLILGVFIGAGIGVVKYTVSPLTVQYLPSTQNHVIAVLVIGVLVAVTEETVFRGMLQRNFATLLSEWTSIVVVSVLFAAMHSVWVFPSESVFALALSIVLGYLYYQFRSLGLVIAVHASVNAVAFVIAPLILP